MSVYMSPRLGLVRVDGTGWPSLPHDVEVPGLDGPVAVRLWDKAYSSNVGGFPAIELRGPSGRLCTMVRVSLLTLADEQPGALVVVWVPSGARDGENLAYDSMVAGPTIAPLIVATWAVSEAADKVLEVPDLDGDWSPEGFLARSVWPTNWRRYQAGEGVGNPRAEPPVPATGPSGVCVIGATLA